MTKASKNLTIEDYRKKLSRARMLIGMLLIVSGITIIIILYQEGFFAGRICEKFNEAMNNEDARAYIDKHRNSLVFRTQTDLVTYDTTAIQTYLRGPFRDLIKKIKIPAGINTNEFKWTVGFYPMHRFDSQGRRRLDFVVVPTFCGIHDEKYIDFRDSVLYPAGTALNVGIIKKGGNCITKDCVPGSTDCLGYDAGHIWP